MKNMILIIALSVLPFVGMSQSDNSLKHFDQQEQISSVLEFDQESIQTNSETSDLAITYYRKKDFLSDDPMEQYEMIQSEKAKNLISIRAFIQSLQMKRKATLMS